MGVNRAIKTGAGTARCEVCGKYKLGRTIAAKRCRPCNSRVTAERHRVRSILVYRDEAMDRAEQALGGQA
jgi:hypothetical protein